MILINLLHMFNTTKPTQSGAALFLTLAIAAAILGGISGSTIKPVENTQKKQTITSTCLYAYNFDGVTCLDDHEACEYEANHTLKCFVYGDYYTFTPNR